MRVLVSGSSGFLMSNALRFTDWEIVKYEYGQVYNDIDLVLHFASPSDGVDFQNKSGMAISMVDMTIKMVNEALVNRCKIIFASSMGAVFLDNEYDVYKKAMEQYIEALCPDHLILRIPRVYGTDRQKGLMRLIRLGVIRDEDWDKEVEYIDILDFVDWFHNILSENSIQYYTGQQRKNTIREIKEIYCKY